MDLKLKKIENLKQYKYYYTHSMENKKNMSSNNSIKSDMEILIEKEVTRRVEENMKKR